MSTTHVVKSWTHLYDAIANGMKHHDLRNKKERDYKVGDKLLLQRYDNIRGAYTGEEMLVEITYITSNETPCALSSVVLDIDHCILSIEPTKYKVEDDGKA